MKSIIIMVLFMLCVSSVFSTEKTIFNSTLHLTTTKNSDASVLNKDDVVFYEVLFKNNGKYPLINPSINISLGDGEIFVPGSLKCLTKSLLTCASHRSGEELLHWNIYGSVKPGEGGSVRYSVKVK